jgi:glycosyltransferase involved in cell wall biosynthesis
VFCEECSPRYGKTTTVFDKESGKSWVLFVGSISAITTVTSWFKGVRPIKWWLGTDALTMWFNPPGISVCLNILHRIKMRILEPFIFQHWVTGPRLLRSLEKCHFIDRDKLRVVYWPGKFKKVSRKIEHEGFNIFYYHPKKSGEFERWVYGIDIIEELSEKLKGVRWIRIDGTNDMDEVYQIADLYLRPSRHDGAPRINLECKMNGIPVLFSEDGNPSAEWFEHEISSQIEMIKR